MCILGGVRLKYPWDEPRGFLIHRLNLPKNMMFKSRGWISKGVDSGTSCPMCDICCSIYCWQGRMVETEV
jgi:hypothetical protein